MGSLKQYIKQHTHSKEQVMAQIKDEHHNALDSFINIPYSTYGAEISFPFCLSFYGATEFPIDALFSISKHS